MYVLCEQGGASTEGEAVLVKLDQVLATLVGDQADALKRELLVGVSSHADMRDYSSQAPTAFNPTEGSLTLPHVGAQDEFVQFVVKDALSARRDLLSANSQVRSIVQSSKDSGGEVLGVVVLSSEDRGTKLFRFNSWESSQVRHQLRQVLGDDLPLPPVFGLFAAGAFFGSSDSPPVVAETDACYAVLSAGPEPPVAAAVGADSQVTSSPDVLTKLEVEIYTDRSDGVIVGKKDLLSSHNVKILSMEFGVPEKAPQPSNTLESLVWGRDKDLDRMRERFPMTRALLLAKAAEKKLPPRSVADKFRALKEASPDKTPFLITALHRHSVNGGRMGDQEDTAQLMASLIDAAQAAGVPLLAHGCHVDSSTFLGQFEDLPLTRTSNDVPVFCDDFVQYGYQLFRAREHGADLIRLHASVLNLAELSYLVKTAKALRMTSLVTCASKRQVLEVLAGIPTLEVLSVTSRNMRLWKVYIHICFISCSHHNCT